MDVTGELEEHRAFLIGVAYRMVGSMDEAEDLVQDAFLRASRADTSEVDEPRAWLTTVVGRLALDHLKSARVQRESYIGPWLPDPIVGDPADRVTLDDQVSLALTTVLETLSPAERVVYVLHEAFGVSLVEVADIVGRTPEACRQLASRARKHVRDGAPRFDTDPVEHARVVEAFRVAVENGDFDTLAQLLDEDVVARADGGGKVKGASLRPVHGRGPALKALRAGLRDRGGDVHGVVRPVNGKPGIVAYAGDQVIGVIDFTVVDGRVTQMDAILNPDKLKRVDRQ